jgi:esterase/lipase superfamily enzyme
VEDDGRIRIDPEVAGELEQSTAKARREILKRLALTPRKEVYVDVHGVATKFNEAVLSVAEFWHFMGREGVPIAYTWPAGEKGLFFYTVDRESGEFTVLHLKQFLRFLAVIPEIEHIHITAHSRGTDVVLTALRELIIESRAAGLDPRERLKIENLVLVAADIDLQVDMQRVVGEAMGPAFGRVTIYTNAEDKALAAAMSLFSSRQRLGTLVPSELSPRQREFMKRMANLDVIVYEGSGGGFFRHSYFVDPVVSSDILMVLRYGLQPGEGKRQGLERLDDKFWRISGN